jgi:large repetitive protein
VISALPPAQAPIAVPDVVTARPGRSIDIDVTANDFSPTGQLVTLVSVDPTPGVRMVGGFVRVTIPSGAVAPIRATYTIESQGTQAVGTLTVTPDAKAALLPLVATADTAPPGVDSTVTVPVLANDRNPNGTLADLTVTTAQPASVVVSHDATSVVVRRGDNDQFAWYTITSAMDKLVAEGLIFVPGKAKLPQPVVPQPPETLRLAARPWSSISRDLRPAWPAARSAWFLGTHPARRESRRRSPIPST